MTTTPILVAVIGWLVLLALAVRGLWLILCFVRRLFLAIIMAIQWRREDRP